jgi:hypothetical protein
MTAVAACRASVVLRMQAFEGAGVNVNTYPVNELLNVVAYHFCAFTKSYRLLVSQPHTT